jgi:hypothetical protein
MEGNAAHGDLRYLQRFPGESISHSGEARGCFGITLTDNSSAPVKLARMRDFSAWLLLIIVLLVACSPNGAELNSRELEREVRTDVEDSVAISPEVTPTVHSSPSNEPIATVPMARTNRRVEAEDDYQAPTFLLPFDGIRPIYEPQFVLADDSPYQEDELVIGITLGGEAKAYPVTVLRFREMVNDELAGIPILVSW